MKLLSRHQLKWLRHRGGRNATDIIWYEDKPYIEMSVKNTPVLYELPSSEEAEKENNTIGLDCFAW